MALRSAPLADALKPVHPGEVGGQFRPLKDADIAAINDNVFRILEQVGFSEATPHCIEACTGVGAVLGDDGRLRMPGAVVENAMARYWVSGEDPGPIGNRHPAIAPFSTFATADGEIVIACGNDALWRRLCAALEAPALADDERFTTNALRAERAEELADALEAVLQAHGTAHWLDTLLEAGIPCARVNRMSDLLNDPHLRARDMIVEMDQPHIGRLPVPGAPIKASGVDADLGDPSPDWGAHTRPVLRELLGIGATDLERLERDGAIGAPGRHTR